MLQLHSKYSGKPDSYMPPASRDGMSLTKEYRESRVGDACFFIEKVLDRIVELDEACAQSVETCRKHLWPHYHEEEAKRDEEMEKREKEEKKRKAKERQKALMEQLAAQRRRFMQAAEASGAGSGGGGNSGSAGDASSAVKMDTSDSESGDPKKKAGEGGAAAASDAAEAEEAAAKTDVAPETKEYTCCHCLLQAPATEERPIGLVTLIQVRL